MLSRATLAKGKASTTCEATPKKDYDEWLIPLPIGRELLVKKSESFTITVEHRTITPG